jgi:hypothetical protein
MSRGTARFQAADVARALRGAAAANKSVARIEIDREGRIVVVLGKPSSDHGTEVNEWDVEFNGKDQTQAR